MTHGLAVNLYDAVGSRATGVRAAIYGRLSLDKQGRGIAVDRQLADCRELAAKRGWTVVAEFRDDSKSAWKKDRKRPGWDDMLAGIKHDQFDAVVIYHGDRLTRHPADLEQLILLAEDKGLKIASATQGQFDFSNPQDLFTLRIFTNVANMESANTARRVKRARLAEAEAGKRHGPLPFGWREESEAAIVQQIVRGLLAGRSLSGLARELNDSGIKSPNGKTWGASNVRAVAKRWQNAGIRTHNGVRTSEGQWPALVTEAEQEAVLRLLSAPERKTHSGTLHKHLLSGVAVCAVCEGPLRAYRRNGNWRYRCTKGFCVTIGKSELEDHVLAGVDFYAKRVAPVDGDAESQARTALANLQARKDQIADAFADGAMDAAQAKRANARLDGQIAEKEEQLRSFEKRTRVAPGIDVYALAPEQQREVIRTLYSRIAVGRKVNEGQWWAAQEEWVRGEDGDWEQWPQVGPPSRITMTPAIPPDRDPAPAGFVRMGTSPAQEARIARAAAS